MARTPKQEPVKLSRSLRKPATTPEARERATVSAAMDLARQQILEGTATSQVIVHFLKLGSSREVLEQERIKHENELLEAKRDALASAKRVEELYAEAITAMRTYSGVEPPREDYDDED